MEYTLIDKKYVSGVGMVKLYRSDKDTYKVTATTEHHEFEALWSWEETAYQMYTEVVDFNTMVAQFQLDGII